MPEVMTERIEIEQIDRHRNGISGEGFYVVLFTFQQDSYDPNDPREPQKMIGIVFDLEIDENDEDAFDRGEFYNPPTAVLDRDLVADGEIRFMKNSWRGDHFDHVLRTAIKKWSSEQYG